MHSCQHWRDDTRQIVTPQLALTLSNQEYKYLDTDESLVQAFAGLASHPVGAALFQVVHHNTSGCKQPLHNLQLLYATENLSLISAGTESLQVNLTIK